MEVRSSNQLGLSARNLGENMSESNEKFESWGLLELFGHQRLAGKLSEQTIGGCHRRVNCRFATIR